MRKLFFTGLITLLPITLTMVITAFVINFLTDPFQGAVESVLAYYDVLDSPFWIFSGEQVLFISSKILVLLFLFVIVVTIGFLGKVVLMRTFFRFGETTVQRIPFFNRVYQVFQDVTKTVFSSKGTTFSKVALVPFPHAESLCIGLIAGDKEPQPRAACVTVFVPGSPNPTAGFMLSYSWDEVQLLDMKVEEAMKFIVSGGIMTSQIKLRDQRDSL